MLVSAVVAMSQNRVIGRNNQLPWHLPADLKHFKKITLGHPIIMGRKTYESIGKALPSRTNIVITRDAGFVAPGCVIVNSIEEALNVAKNNEEVFVIGGSLLFEQMLPRIQKLYLTIIHEDFSGDAFFPEINLNEWKEISREDYVADDVNRYGYSFLTYEKNK